MLGIRVHRDLHDIHAYFLPVQRFEHLRAVRMLLGLVSLSGANLMPVKGQTDEVHLCSRMCLQACVMPTACCVLRCNGRLVCTCLELMPLNGYCKVVDVLQPVRMQERL